MTDIVEQVLAHHGVLGMHWGKHLPGRTEESHNPKPKRIVRVESSEDHTNAHNLRNNPRHTLSTAELRAINERLQAEKKYRELNPDTITKGKKVALGVIAAAGTGITVYNMVHSPAGKDAIKIGSKFMDKYLSRAIKDVKFTQAAKLSEKFGVGIAKTIMSTL